MTAAAAGQTHFLARLASQTPRSELHPEANSYIALLDRALLDRQLSRHEQDELVAVAQMMGLSREEALAIHRYYLNALGKLALADGQVTSEEHADLRDVATMLGLDDDDLEDALHSVDDVVVGCEVSAFCLSLGDAVVFTGESPDADRADLEYQAKSLGLRVTGAVSGKTTLVVAADPDSISGKARKARELGLPIVDYPTYGQLLQAFVSRTAAA
jgi:DNA polymerase-3 subunit epsilon